MAVPTTGFLGLLKPLLNQFSRWGKYYNDNWDMLDAIITKEHNPDGSHKAISTTTIAVSGDITVAGVSLAAELANAAKAKAERIAAEAAASAADTDRIAAQAAWTAALAANPDLNPQVRMNPQQVTADLAIPDNYNAYASGPLEVAMGVTITVGANANLNII